MCASLKQVVTAFIVLKTSANGIGAGTADGTVVGDEEAERRRLAAITREIQDMVRAQVGRHCYPRRVVFVAELPRTPSGKIQRFVLKSKYHQLYRDK